MALISRQVKYRLTPPNTGRSSRSRASAGDRSSARNFDAVTGQCSSVPSPTRGWNDWPAQRCPRRPERYRPSRRHRESQVSSWRSARYRCAGEAEHTSASASASTPLPSDAHALSAQSPGSSATRHFLFTNQGIVVPDGKAEHYTFFVANWHGPDHKPEWLRELLNMHWIIRNLHKATAIIEYLLSYPTVKLRAESREDLQNEIDDALLRVIWDKETLSLLSEIILFDPGHCTSRYNHTHVELTQKCQQNALHVFEPGAVSPYQETSARDMREWWKYVDKLLRNPSKMTRFPVFPVRASIICGGSTSVAESQICYGATHSPLGICDVRVMFCFKSLPGLDLKAEYKRWDWRRFLDCPEAVRKDFVKKAMRVYDVLYMTKLQSAIGVRIRHRDLLLVEAKAQKAVGFTNNRLMEKRLPAHVLWARKLIIAAMHRERGLGLDPSTGITKAIA